MGAGDRFRKQRSTAAWQRHGSRPRDARRDNNEQGDEMSTMVTDTQTTIERWTADPHRTTIEFEVDHLWGLHTVRGRFCSFEGEYIVGPHSSQIKLTIDATSVDTGNAARDKHLRSDDFFATAEHSQVSFTSTRITGLGNGQVHVHGQLEVAGTSIAMEFDASVRVIDGELELETTTTVDQRRFAMSRGPLRNVLSPATLHVKTRLAQEP
jgi:polyisoprenoid-binding protein YceI